MAKDKLSLGTMMQHITAIQRRVGNIEQAIRDLADEYTVSRRLALAIRDGKKEAAEDALEELRPYLNTTKKNQRKKLPRRRYRSWTAVQKDRIVREYEAATGRGEKALILRKWAVSATTVHNWRRRKQYPDVRRGRPDGSSHLPSNEGDLPTPLKENVRQKRQPKPKVSENTKEMFAAVNEARFNDRIPLGLEIEGDEE